MLLLLEKHEMLRHIGRDDVAETGRMLNADELPEKLAGRIFKTEDT